jgi:zinc protease
MKRLLFASAFAVLFAFFAPAPAPAAAQEAPRLNVQRVTSPGGIEAWLVEDHSLPLVTMKFFFRGGLINDPEDKPGVAKLVSVLLDEGAGEMRSQAFQAQLSNHAIGMAFSPGRDAFYGTLRSTSEHKQLGFDLLRMALTRPRFDADAVTRMKNALSADITTNLGDPAWLSARTFNGIVFEGHYYAQPGGGTLSGIAAITRRDLEEFVRSQFTRDALRVVVVGDMTPAETMAMLDGVFGALPAKGHLPQGRNATLAHAGRTVMLPLDTPQTYIALAQPGVPRTDREWYTAQVMTFILGGGSFDARLMREVREKRGLTYGIYSSLLTQQDGQVLQTTLSVGNAKTAEALAVIRDEFKRMADAGVTAEELANAKSYLIGSMPLELTTTSDIADALSGLQLFDLGPQELAERRANIESVTAGDIKTLARRLLDPASMTTILVGQPEGIDVDILLDSAPGLDQGGATP